jgi:putative cell wall-binding protein
VCDQFDPPPQSIGGEVALSVTALEPGTTYHYAVAPVNVDGNRGPISDSVSVTTDGTPPDDGPSDGGGSSDENGSDGEDAGDGSSDDGGGSSDGDDGTSDGGGGTSDGGGGTADGGSGSGGGGGQDTAEVGLTLQRLDGSNRMSTSVQASQEAFGNGQADAVVLARADEFADALAGVPFADVVGGPLLLTHSDGLDEGVAGELQRVLADGGAVWLLGGNGALSQQVEQRIAEMGYEPKRLAGRNRFETAAIIAEFGLSAPDRALLATGGEFADAVTAGAAAAHTDAAVLLTAGDKLPPATAQYLQQQTPSVQHAVGGPAAAAAPQIPALVGATRYETAATVADELFDQPARAGLATGTAFPDSLTGGAHIAGYGGPMLLSPPDGLHQAAADYLTAQAASVTTTVLYGGPAALNQAVADGAQAAVAAAGS